MPRTPTDRPADPWGRPRDLYMEGFAAGTRRIRTWCVISAILGTVVGMVVAAAVMI